MNDTQRALVMSIEGMEAAAVYLAQHVKAFEEIHARLSQEAFHEYPGTKIGERSQHDFIHELPLAQLHLMLAHRLRTAGLGAVLLAGRAALSQTPPLSVDAAWVTWWENRIRQVVPATSEER